MHRRRVLGDGIRYVGLDVHKDGIVVAVAEGGLRSEVRDYGRIANTPAALRRLAHKLDREGVTLRLCRRVRALVNLHQRRVARSVAPARTAIVC
jgi:hypothetical protein